MAFTEMQVQMLYALAVLQNTLGQWGLQWMLWGLQILELEQDHLRNAEASLHCFWQTLPHHKRVLIRLLQHKLIAKQSPLT
jgi:hypothetical protein